MFTHHLGLFFKQFYALDIHPFRFVSTLNRDCSIGMDWQDCPGVFQIPEFCFAEYVGTLPDGYACTYPLPQVPTKQSVPTRGKCLPTYFGTPLLIPTLRRAMQPAIARVQTPWWFGSLNHIILALGHMGSVVGTVEQGKFDIKYYLCHSHRPCYLVGYFSNYP
jgi:hypothetical protein